MIILDLNDPAPIPLKLLDSGAEFELMEAVRVNIVPNEAGSTIWVEVPAGYRTDLASIPPEAGIIGFEKLGRHSYAAIVHDWMFSQQMGYELANAAFYGMLLKLGVPWWKSMVMTFACEAGGKSRYKQCGKRLRKRSETLTATA